MYVWDEHGRGNKGISEEGGEEKEEGGEEEGEAEASVIEVEVEERDLDAEEVRQPTLVSNGRGSAVSPRSWHICLSLRLLTLFFSLIVCASGSEPEDE